ncbi:MAG TPA: GyrI-like domain-containing protein [Cyclobacteriaceae bacterium]|nr:GyrI-like domain-containing protein [Cyclobacteriaceae bacterium]
MQVKEIKPINFLFFRTRTKVSELGRYVGIVARELYRDAFLNDLEVTGPIYWNYIGFEGDEAKEFTLEVALPVAEIPASYEGKFRVKRDDTFYCVSLSHEGSWFDFPSAYGKLMRYIEENKLQPVALKRELYINMDFNNPVANITEIQIGISAESFELLKNAPVVKDEVAQDL